MNNQEIYQNMTFLFSICLDQLTKMDLDSNRISPYFKVEDLKYINRCAHNTKKDFTIEDQERLVHLASILFLQLDEFSSGQNLGILKNSVGIKTKH